MTNVNRWTGVSLAVGLAVYVVKLHVLGHQPHRSILQTPRANMSRKRHSIGIRADLVGRLGQFFGGLPVDSGDSDRKCGGEHEIARVVATETNFSNDFDVTVRKPKPLLAAYTQERAAASEERLRIGCISSAAKFTGQRQLHIKQPVLAADMAMAAASCGNFGGIQSAHDSI